MDDITLFLYNHLKTQYIWPDIVGLAVTSRPDNRLEYIKTKISKYLKHSDNFWRFHDESPIGRFMTEFLQRIDYPAMYERILEEIQEDNK